MPSGILRPLDTAADCYTLWGELGEESLPLLRILDLARASGAKYCVAWEDDDNREWAAEHMLMYNAIFPPLSTSVNRLDFFASDPWSGSQESQYRGYVSIRPGTRKTVVECVMQPPQSANHYYLCTGDWSTAFPGPTGNMIPATIKGASFFLQQDGVVGVCAHASIRMLSALLASKHTTCHAMTVKDIENEFAGMPLLEGSHLPSSGLTNFQIVKAIEGMGASASLYNFVDGKERNSHSPLERLVYPYLESGIPTILGIRTEGEAHALLVVGHTFDRESWWQFAERRYFPSIGGKTAWIPSYSWAPDFIIQDDNVGPFLSCPRTVLGPNTLWVVVPVPKECGMYLQGHQVESLSALCMLSEGVASLFMSKTKTTIPWRKTFSRVWNGEAVLRPLLVTKERFLKHIQDIGLSNSTRNAYESMPMPAWIWLVEISVPELYGQHLKVGEVLLNPSYPSQHLVYGNEALLAMRIFDVLNVGKIFTSPTVSPADGQPVGILKSA